MAEKDNLILIIGLIILALLFYKFSGASFFSVFFGLNEFNCGFDSDNKLMCSASGSSMQGSPLESSGIVTFKINNPYNLYFKQFSYFRKYLIQDSNWNAFFSANPNVCYQSGGMYRLFAGEQNRLEYWRSTLNLPSMGYWQSSWDDGCFGVDGGRYSLNLDDIINKKFPNQLLIVKGKIRSAQYTEQNPVYIDYTTYGFCNLVTGDCKLFEPVLNDWNKERYASIDYAEIKLKLGGYIESEISCAVDNSEKCESTLLYVCSNYNWINRGNIEGKCGYESKKIYYRLENNVCNQIEIYPSEKTDNDYSNLSDCNSQIFQSICTENWNCTSWSACSNSQQSRTCSDLNNCETLINKPALTQSCSIPSGGGGGPSYTSSSQSSQTIIEESAPSETAPSFWDKYKLLIIGIIVIGIIGFVIWGKK